MDRDSLPLQNETGDNVWKEFPPTMVFEMSLSARNFFGDLYQIFNECWVMVLRFACAIVTGAIISPFVGVRVWGLRLSYSISTIIIITSGKYSSFYYVSQECIVSIN